MVLGFCRSGKFLRRENDYESLHNDWIKDTIIQDVDSLSKKQIEEELKCSNYYNESYIKLVKSVDDLKSLLIDLRFEKECR